MAAPTSSFANVNHRFVVVVGKPPRLGLRALLNLLGGSVGILDIALLISVLLSSEVTVQGRARLFAK